ncbi:MAG: hypothetical protein GKS01_03030 [Alphaproteobacteria bacterium]|nr:hypothetical protein [Alphaproteobacteria bacterium]
MPESKIHNLFPTPLWVVDFEKDVFTSVNQEIESGLETLIESRPEVPSGGTLQTDTDLYEFEEFAEIAALIGTSVKGALDFLSIKEPFEITGMWANINPVGGVNTPHTHPNNYLSGVYYVRTDDGSDQIFFADPRPPASVVSPPVEEDNIYTGNEASVEAKIGRLIMFPAWLTHGVPANRSGKDRISISFNIMFPAFGDRMSKPKWSPTLQLQRTSHS